MVLRALGGSYVRSARGGGGGGRRGGGARRGRVVCDETLQRCGCFRLPRWVRHGARCFALAERDRPRGRPRDADGGVWLGDLDAPLTAYRATNAHPRRQGCRCLDVLGHGEGRAGMLLSCLMTMTMRASSER